MGDSTVQPGGASAATQQSTGTGAAAAPTVTGGSGGSGSGGAAAAPAGAATIPGTVLAIKVSFELDTEDGLRKVFFGLEKDIKNTDAIWIIHFQLQERPNTSATFTNVVTLDVTVDEEALHPAAEAAAKNGMTPPQAAHALGPAADDAKGTTTGDVDKDDASDTVKNTLAQ